MARISGADPSKQGLLSGLLTRIVYGMTKRKLGRLVMPVRIAAHHSKILWGSGQLEQSRLGGPAVELTATLAWENYRARFDHAFGVEAEGFTQGSYCAMPVLGAAKARAQHANSR